jgi:hypothetical protein
MLTMAGWWSIIEGTSTHVNAADAAAQAIWIQKRPTGTGDDRHFYPF